jgi:hypothetical protein
LEFQLAAETARIRSRRDLPARTEVMKVLKKLGNPMVLVAEGFVLGAFLFFATHPETGRDIADMTFAAAEVPGAAQSLL